MRKVAIAIVAATGLLLPSLAVADAPSLKVTPLKYQENVPLGKTKIGYIDVSNPTDQRVSVGTQLQAFKQINNEGELRFYDDPEIANGITLNLKNFELGPKEALRMAFSIDPNKLGERGVYAAIFFRTSPTQNQGSGTVVSTNVRVGSLLILKVGNGRTEGNISKVSAFPLQFGNSIKGTIDYANVAQGTKAVAFNPKLKVTTGLFGKTQTIDGPLVMAGNTRHVKYERKGSFIGLVPVHVTDQIGHAPSKTAYVIAVTGWWRVGLPLILIIGLIGWRLLPRIRRKKTP